MKKYWVPIVIAFATIIFLGSLISTGHWFNSQTKDDYLYNLEAFRDSFSHGHWYPRWYPRFAGGYGYPMLVYYHPGALYLTLPFTYIFPSVVYAFYASIILMTYLGGLGAYKLARLYCNDAASLLCMALFYTTHYLPADFFGRGDIPEFFSMLLMPWGVYYIIIMSEAIGRGKLPMRLPVIFTGLTFVLSIMHPFAFLYCVPLAVAALAGKWVEGGYNSNILTIPLLCIAIALTLSAPYWYTLLEMKDFVHYHNATFLNARAESLTKFFTGAYYNPGRLQFALALPGWFIARKQVFFRYLFGLYVFLVFLMSHWSDCIWEMNTPLSFTQFPWRINTVLVTLELIGITQLVRWASPYIERVTYKDFPVKFYSFAIVALLPLYVFDVTLWPEPDIKYKDPFRIWGTIYYEAYKRDMEYKEFRFLVFYHEFHPLTSNFDSLPNRLTTSVPMVQPPPGIPPSPDSQPIITMDPASTDYVIQFTVASPASETLPMKILINQMYLPGWKVTVNGQDIAFANNGAASNELPSLGIGNHGRIRLNFPKNGTYKVVAWYDGPPGWEMRNSVMAVLIPLLACALYWQCRKVKSA